MQPIRAQKHQQWLSYPLEMLSWMLVLQFSVCSSLGRDLSMDEESDPLGSAAFLVQHFGHRVSLSFQARLRVGSGEAPRGESRLPHADGPCFPSCLQPGVVQGSLRLRLESSWNYRGHSAGWAVFPPRWDPAAAPVLCFEVQGAQQSPRSWEFPSVAASKTECLNLTVTEVVKRQNSKSKKSFNQVTPVLELSHLGR